MIAEGPGADLIDLHFANAFEHISDHCHTNEEFFEMLFDFLKKFLDLVLAP